LDCSSPAWRRSIASAPLYWTMPSNWRASERSGWFARRTSAVRLLSGSSTG
jgi:hypothetical protein